VSELGFHVIDTGRPTDFKLHLPCIFVVSTQHFTLLGNVHLTQGSLCRMTRASTRQAVGEAASLRTQSGSQASGSDAEETFPVTNLITNPPERTPTTLNRRAVNQLCFLFGIREADARLPERNQFADIAPLGFVTVNKQMCSHGAIPPFNDFLGTFLRSLSIAPSQLHPNGYVVLLGLCVLFSRTLNRLPTFEEICFYAHSARARITLPL